MTKEEIKEVRKALKVSQKVFAALLGVSLRAVQNWEAGKSKPLPVNLKNLQIHMELKNEK